MIRSAIFLTICALLLAGCATDQTQNAACAQQALTAPPSVRGNLAWGYYPGYGCGPVPPAQTKFS